MKVTQLQHCFVAAIPSRLSSGVLYVAMKYGTAAHLCCCGCGAEIVTPLTPTDWSMTFDGETVSLSPSIGNWNLPCRSHYWIHRSRVTRAGDMPQALIDAGRRRDRRAKDAYFRLGGTGAEIGRKREDPA